MNRAPHLPSFFSCPLLYQREDYTKPKHHYLIVKFTSHEVHFFYELTSVPTYRDHFSHTFTHSRHSMSFKIKVKGSKTPMTLYFFVATLSETWYCEKSPIVLLPTKFLTKHFADTMIILFCCQTFFF